MAQPMYRDYSQWVQALEPRLAWTRLTRGQFRNLAYLLMLLFFAAAGVLLGRMAVIKNGYQIVELRQERDSLLAQRKQNERRLREMMSLDHAELVARRDLKMVDVNPNQVIHLGSNLTRPSAPTKVWRALFGD